jgi:protein phosphatase 1G
MSFFSDEEEENVKNLYEEAEMPLEQVMAKYQHDHCNPNSKKIKQEDGKAPVSPFLRGRHLCSSRASSSKCSTSMLSGSGNGSTESAPDSGDKQKERDTEVSSSSTQGQCSSSSSNSRQQLGNSKEDQASDCSTSNGETKSTPEAGEEMEATKHKTMPDSSGNSEIQNTDKTADQSKEENSSFKVSDAGDIKQEVNGEIGEGNTKDSEQTTRDCEGVTSSLTPHENGEVVKGESKGKSPGKASSSCDSNKEDKKHFTLRHRTATALYRTLLGSQDQSDSDSDDEGDESFQGAENR